MKLFYYSYNQHIRSMDLVSVHDAERNCRFLGVSALVAMFISLNSPAEKLEKFRFLGPFRYLLFIALLITAKAPSLESLWYKPMDRNKKGLLCVVKEVDGVLQRCTHCDAAAAGVDDDSDVDNDSDVDDDWVQLKKLDGSITGDIAFQAFRWLVPIKGVVDSRWESLHHGDGTALISLRPSLGIGSFFKFFACWYADMAHSRYFNPPVCTEVVFREAELELTTAYTASIDGEVLKENLKKMRVKAHRGVAEGYGTGQVDGWPNVAISDSIAKVRRLMVVTLLIIFGILAGLLFVGWTIYERLSVIINL